MKKAIIMAAFLVFAATAHAQTGQFGSLNGAPPVGSGASINTNGGLNSDTGLGNPSGLTGNSPSTSNISDTNPGEYIPSRFEGYKDAVSDGKAMANRKPMTIAEMARQSQAEKKAAEGKKVMVLEQDSNGKLTIAAPTAAPAPAAPAAAPATVAVPTTPAATSPAASEPASSEPAPASARPGTEMEAKK
jgi:hypothetical protein